ncbi:hypothetical protein B7P43_G05958 [Cryptotermes secundus]|uniref:Uncharacterized protein n=1 Tax=Cryptotermes secundus TaxID=105785 RepID=A0A2J7PZU3_9NEOP|nr:hypothetical protein B7P43_G05958 [Cryptotermes secundus]
MDSLQIMELLLAMQAKADARYEEAKIEQAKADARHEEMMADWKAWGEERRTSHKKIVPETEKEMTAIRGMEAAEHQEVPAEDAPRIPVGEPKERRRDRKLATERRRQKLKDLPRVIREPQKELAVTSRGKTRREEAAHRTPQYKKPSRRATMARCWRNDFRRKLPREPSDTSVQERKE